MISAIVFDMDGVLIDTERLSLEAWLQTGADYNIDHIKEIHHNCIGMTRENINLFLTSVLGNAFDIEAIQTHCRDIMEEMIAKNGLPMKPYVYEILNYLKENNYQIALATSTSKKSALEHLNQAKIINYFNTIVTGDMIKNGKPDPEIYLRACKELSVSPKNAIAVEDSYNGVKSAAAAGLCTIMIPDMLPPNETTNKLTFKTLNNLKELKQAFENDIFKNPDCR